MPLGSVSGRGSVTTVTFFAFRPSTAVSTFSGRKPIWSIEWPGLGVESPRWRTYPFPVAPGRYWGAGYTRNPFGVGTRVVTGSDKIVVAGVGQKILLTDADTVEVDLALGTYFVIFFDSGRASRIMQFVNPPHDGYGFILESHQSGDGSQTYDLDTEQVINYTSEIPSSALPASPYAIRNHGFVYDLTGDYYSLDGISTPLTF